MSWEARRDALLASYQHEAPAPYEEQERVQREKEQAMGSEPNWVLDEERNSGVRVRRWCREQARLPEQMSLERCVLEPLGGGAVLLLTLVTECGGDSCATEGYVASARLDGFVRVPHDVGGGAEASPSGDALFLTKATDVAGPPPPEGVVVSDPWGGSEPLMLARVELSSMKSEPFAPCFSPALSPKGRWLVCRDRAANVLRVPLDGGTPNVVVRSGLEASEVDFVSYAYIWPSRVEFVGEDRMTYDVTPAGGEVQHLESRWTE